MYLRGVIHMNQNNFDRAKEFFLRAVQVDARCYQAYEQLITNSLLDPDEGIISEDPAECRTRISQRSRSSRCTLRLSRLYSVNLSHQTQQSIYLQNKVNHSINIQMSSLRLSNYYKTHLVSKKMPISCSPEQISSL